MFYFAMNPFEVCTPIASCMYRILVRVFSARGLLKREDGVHTQDALSSFLLVRPLRRSGDGRRTRPLAASTFLVRIHPPHHSEICTLFIWPPRNLSDRYLCYVSYHTYVYIPTGFKLWSSCYNYHEDVYHIIGDMTLN